MAVFGRLSGWRLTRTGVLFVIGIIVLGGLVTGGIFLVKNHGEAVRRDQAVKIAEQNLKDQSQTSTQPVNASDSSNSGNTDTTNTTGTTATTDAGSAAALPVTGIDEMQFLGRVAMLAVLALSAAYYVASRRAADRL